MNLPAGYVFFKVSPGCESEVLKKLRKIREVKEAHSVYGIYDLIAKIEYENENELKKILSRIRKWDKIEETVTSLIL